MFKNPTFRDYIMKLYLTFLLSFITICTFAQTKISGTITDEHGYEISYATVMFADKSL